MVFFMRIAKEKPVTGFPAVRFAVRGREWRNFMEGKREEQMKEITERLEQGLQELFTSEKYTEYLKTMSQFHNYSFNNTLLIAMQKPEATLVAGYGSWQKKFNRQVKRGEKGIRIIAPAPVKRKEEVEKFDPETNEPILRPDGQPETEEVEHIIPRFRVATVFDISQTDGDPLPELDTPELMGDVENFPIFMEAIGLVSPAPIRYAEIEGEAKGYYSNADKEIVIQEGMSEKQAMKTAVHEVTHAMCHDRDLMEEAGEKKNQVTREVEAESVAYTVCSYFGLDTSDYSFPYIAGWSSSMDMKELRSSMNFIRKTAGSFIDGMVENIQKLQKEKETEQDKEGEMQAEAEADAPVQEENVQDAAVRANEELLYTDPVDRYAIFQINEKGKGREYLFSGMNYIKSQGMEVDGNDYSLVYSGRLGQRDNLDTIYGRFNINHPADYTGHSLSVSDVIVLNRGGKLSAHFVECFGFADLPDFIGQRKQFLENGAAIQGEEKEIYPSVYPHTLEYVMEHGRADDYLDSRKLNLDCKKAVEDAIRKNFDGMHLAYDAAESVLEEYGAERVTFVLANTVQQLDYDGRFSRDNKEWAEGFEIPDNINHGRDMNADYIVTSHPAVLDGFIGLARNKIREQELQRETEVKINGEIRGYTADGHFGTWHTAEVREINGERFYRMEHDTYGGSVASIIVTQEGKLAAEDLEHGFDQGAMEAIYEYLVDQEKLQMAVSPVSQQAGPEESISFYVAECMEFPSLGEYHERLETLQEAMELYEKIPEERMNGMKGIGFRLENGSIYDGNFDLMVAGELQTEFINSVAEYRNSPLVQKAVADMGAILAGQTGQDRIGPEKEVELTQQPIPKHSGEKNKNIQTQETGKVNAGKINAAMYKMDREDVHAEPQAPEPEKPAETAPETDKSVTGGSRKQSVLNALRERQARLKAQEKEKQGQKPQAYKKGEQEL